MPGCHWWVWATHWRDSQ